MDWKRLFYKNENKTLILSNSIERMNMEFIEFSLEDLYQAFKARMQEELKSSDA